MKRAIIGVLTIFFSVCLFASCGSKGIDQNYGMKKSAEYNGVKVYYQKDAEWAEYLAKHITEDANGFFEKTKCSPDMSIYLFDKKEDFLKNMTTQIEPSLERYYIVDQIEPNKLIAVSMDDAGVYSQKQGYMYTFLNTVTSDKIEQKYKNISPWLGSGMSIYFSYGEDVERIALRNLSGKKAVIPFEDTQKSPSPADNSYYSFSQLYFKYLMDTYGWDKCDVLAETMDYPAVLGKSEEEIFEEWKMYLQSNERFSVIFR